MATVYELLRSFLDDERVLTGLTVTVVGLSMNALSQKHRWPPGPPVWPVVGSLPYYRNDAMIFKEFAEQYGDIFFLQLGLFGQMPTIVLSNMELVREALLQKKDDFAGRSRTIKFDIFSGNGSDIVFGNFDAKWKFQRKIAHYGLRKFSSGSKFHDVLKQNVDTIGELFQSSNGKPHDIYKAASLIFYNTIATLCFEKKYEMNDPEFNHIRNTVDDLNDFFEGFFFSDLYPMFRKVQTPSIKYLKKVAEEFFKFVNSNIAHHRQHFDKSDIKDLTDYIIHIEKEMNDKGTEQNPVQLSNVHLQQILLDMFFAGTDTSRITLTWALMFMAANPELQEKAQKEIDEQIGRDGQITMSSRTKIPYCEAIIFETLRLRSPAPMALPHATTCDTCVGGYDIPKGTQVFINLVRIHTDPREWDNPEEFRPERFLDKHGNLAPKPNAFLPFSTGRRQCVGEAFAKSELHIIFGMLLQRFKFHPPEGKIIDLSPKKNLFVFIPKDSETHLVIKER